MTNLHAPGASAPAVFSFDSSFNIRVIDQNGEPWFVAKDVCDALGLSNSRMALQALDDDEKGVSSTDTPGGMQELAIVNESGLYTLILRCRDATKPGTLPHRFRKWITSEVLPAIRKTGRYQVAPPPEPTYEKITRAQVDELSRAINHAFTGWMFHAEAPQHGHNALRVRFNLRTLADLPAADFERAKVQVEWYAQATRAFVTAGLEARRRFLVEIIGANAPWTPALLRKLTAEALTALPARPNWSEIHRQLEAPAAAP